MTSVLRTACLMSGESGKTFLALLFSVATTLSFILPPQARAQEEIVCIQCHDKLQGRLSEPVGLWRGSIHAENGIACNGCHGGDPKDMANAMNPARGFIGAPKEEAIPAFCGRCHVGVLRDYLQSPHGRALGHGGPTCVTCHSNHRVVKASLAIINEQNCSRCHGFERAMIIKEAMTATDRRLNAIDQGIAGYKGMGIDTERLEKGLFAVRNRFHSLFHEVDVRRVQGEAGGINAELDKLDTVLQEFAAEQVRRRLIGAAAVGVALIAALLFYLLKRSYDKNLK